LEATDRKSMTALDDQQARWPRVSVIVPVYNDETGIRRCLGTILAQAYPGEREIIVVDNAAEFSLGVLAAEHPEVTFIAESSPGSYNARNAGLRIATGEVFAFTDADCRPQEQWLKSGVAALMADPGVAMVGGRIDLVIDHDGAPTLPELYQMALAFPQKVYVEQQSYAATANMFTRRSTFDKVGAFNGGLKSGGDAEFGRRVGSAGLRLAYAPDAVVQHPARTSYREIFIKARRVVGGERDRRPGWRNCLRYCFHNLTPSRRRLTSILKNPNVSFGPITKIKLVALAISINWAYAYWRLVLQLTNAESSRS